MTTPTRLTLLPLAALGAVAISCDEPPPATDADSLEIVGGAPATDPKYDAVGALVDILPDGTTSPFCTGALFDEKLVVTAKHCLLLTPPDAEIGFAIGYDGKDPDHVVPVVGRLWERTVTDGIMMLGSDVAVLVLGEEVEDIEPVEIRASPHRGTYEAVGFGAQSHFFEPPAPEFGTRQRGTMTLAAVGPSAYWPVIYDGDYDAFVADWAEGSSDPDVLAEAEEVWANHRLAEDYDAVFLRKTVGTAGGDSGGPILRRRGNRWRSYGVASGIVFLPARLEETVRNFTVYSTFGPETMHFVEAARACGAIPREGVCDGETLRYCGEESDDDGDEYESGDDDDDLEFEMIDVPCDETCVLAPAGAQCAPACANDGDCDLVAANGVCEDGACTWSSLERCMAEPGAFGCFLCCIGQAGEDFAACGAACFPPDASDVSALLASFPDLLSIRQ